WKVGLVVFLVDLVKGALPVALLPGVTTGSIEPAWLPIIYGAAAILGHVRPVWLGFGKGGKGVATACGVFLALTTVPTLFALAVFIVTFGATGYVSLGSLAAAVGLPLFVGAVEGGVTPLVVVSVLIALFIFWTHRQNMGRLRRGEEHRFAKMGALGVKTGLLLALVVTAAVAAWLYLGAVQ
ncbi:MAG TPA: glycerol-3-phosphate acyltransferase, partial [Gemmatimonadaceae bacterium]